MTSAKYDKKSEEKEDFKVELRTKGEYRRPSDKEVAACKPCRLCLVGTFLLFLIGLLVASIVLIATTDKCKQSQEEKASAVAYQVYVKSFKDSDSDGYGDFNGLRSKLPYIKSLGTKVIILTDVVGKLNLKLDRDMGTLDDLKNFIRFAKDDGIDVFIQMNPLVVSADNDWFLESKRKSTKRHWFIWSEKNGTNNWQTTDGRSAWHNTNENQTFYSHFGSSLPTLNYSSQDVVDEITKIIEWWLDQGVKGFVFTSVSRLAVDPNLRSNNGSLVYDKNLPNAHGILSKFYKTVNNKGGAVWVIPRTDTKNSMQYFGANGKREADVVLNDDFALMEPSSLDAQKLNESLTNYLTAEPAFGSVGWMVGGSSYKRLATRFGGDQAKLMSLFLLTLPRFVLNYYGDELLLEDASPGKSFSIMKWNDKPDAGFTNGTSWLPVSGSYNPTVGFANLSNIRSSMNAFRYVPTVVYAKGKVLVLQYRRPTELLVALNFDAGNSKAENVTKAVKGEYLFHTDAKQINRAVDLKNPLDVPGNSLFLVKVVE